MQYRVNILTQVAEPYLSQINLTNRVLLAKISEYDRVSSQTYDSIGDTVKARDELIKQVGLELKKTFVNKGARIEENLETYGAVHNQLVHQYIFSVYLPVPGTAEADNLKYLALVCAIGGQVAKSRPDMEHFNDTLIRTMTKRIYF